MVSRTAVALVALVALASGVYSQTDGSTQTQNINKFVPQTTLYTSTAIANVGVTPAFPAITGRKMLATYNSAAMINPEFNTSVLQFTAKNNPQFIFVGESQEQFLTEIATVNYIFGTYSLPFLNQITKSGATYKFLRALVYTPQEPAATATPFVSTTGLLTGTGSPFVATISTKNATTFLPNVGVRFDYSQSVGSPFVSIYYSDRVSTGGNNPANPSSNLKLAQGVYIDMNGNIIPGTNGK